MATSPTARTLAELKKLGRIVQVVERWNQYARVRIDLFGVIDLVYIDEGLPPSFRGNGIGEPAIVGVQTTSGAHHADRRTKILAEPRALAWIRAGGRIELWTWAKHVKRVNGKAWVLRVEVITEQMFACTPVAAEGVQAA